MATIKKGDLVQVITGRKQDKGGDKGKQGLVLAVNRETNRVIVEGINLVTKHVKVGQNQAGAKTGGIEVAEAEKQILAYLASVGVAPGKSPLAGNSVSVDRNFIARDMKALADYLHYRTIDVSTIKELSRRWYPKAYFAAPAKTGNHRALGDIQDSIAELAYYRQAVFARKVVENKRTKNRFLNFGPWRVK